MTLAHTLLKFAQQPMKNIYEVIRQKELQLQQVQKELDALKMAASLLNDTAAQEAGAAGVGSTRASGQAIPIEVAARAAASETTKRWP